MPVNNQGYYMPGFGGVPPASSSYYDHGVRTSNYAPGPVDVIVVSGALGVSLSGATFSLSGTQSVQGFVTATFAGVSQPVNVTSPITATFGGQAQPVTVSGTILVASSVSASVWENSSSFVGSNYSVVFGPIDFSLWKNLALTVINNSPNNIQSASIEWSPNNNQYEQWNTTTFANLSGNGTVLSMQISGNSRKYMRIRMISSGSSGQLTGSTDIFVNANN